MAFRAGREMLQRIEALSEQRVDFSIETTLSGKSYVSWLRSLENRGYEIYLYFLWLPDVQMSISRVADRVKHGGHNIPEPVIRRRYAAGIGNLLRVYRPLLDSWSLFDNSRPLLYTVAIESGGSLTVFDEALLAQFMKKSKQSMGEELQETRETPEWVKATIAMRRAMVEVIEEHIKTGHPLIIWRNGKVYRQPPEEAKWETEQALKNDPWALTGTTK